MAIKHQAFLDLEESLASRLRNAWAQYWGKVSTEIVQLTAQGKWDEAHKVAEAIDLGPLFSKSRPFIRTVGMSALLLGASRLRNPRQSRVAKQPPLKELDSFLNQTETMLTRNASQALRQMAHEWVAQEEAKLLKADWREEDHPRGKTTPDSTPGSFISVTSTPEFKAWFGKSKVVDKKGKPLVVYHHTYEDFRAFKPGGYDPNLSGHAIWMTGERDADKANFNHQRMEAIARGKGVDAAGNIISEYEYDRYYRNVGWEERDDPKVLEVLRRIGEAYGGAGEASGFRIGYKTIPLYVSLQNPKVWKDRSQITLMTPERVAKLKAAGHDGAISYNKDGTIDEVVVFESWQVKGIFNPRPTKHPEFMKSSEVAKLDTGADRNQVKINVAGKNYFGLASSIQVSRLSAFGFLAEAAESGVKNYRIDAVLDEKTCEVCRHMDGWVFPVEQGMALAQQIMDTEDPDALKQLAPFYAQNKASLAALAQYGTDDFIDVGMSLPPFHPLCRCILTPTDEEADVHPTDVSDRVALASQALYGEGDGVRLTRDLFGVEQLPDEQTTVAPPTEDEARITDLLEQVLREPPTAPRERWIPDTAALWAVPPPTDVQPSALVSPQPFEGTTIPRKWTEPFDPQRLAALASSKWPWLAGILGWLALREHRQPSDFDPGDAEEDDEEDELP